MDKAYKIKGWNYKTVGLIKVFISLIIVFVILNRFYEQGTFDGKLHGIIYEFPLPIKNWIPTFIYMILLLISGILNFIKHKNELIIFRSIIICFILDRLIGWILLDYQPMFDFEIDFILPISVSTSILYINLKLNQTDKIKPVIYALSILIGVIVPLIVYTFIDINITLY